MDAKRTQHLVWIPIVGLLVSSCSGGSSSTGDDLPVKRWSGATLIETQDGNAGGVTVSLADDGLGFAVWSAASAVAPRDRRIFASRELANGEWSDPEIIDDGDGDPFGPTLALQPTGDAIVVWTEVEGDDSGQHIYANTFSRQSGWSGPLRLSVHDHQERPSLAANDQGNAIAAWRASDIFGRSIAASTFDPQSGWTSGDVIDSSLVSSSDAKVAIDSSGNGFAAWTDDYISSRQNEVYVSRYSAPQGGSRQR